MISPAKFLRENQVALYEVPGGGAIRIGGHKYRGGFAVSDEGKILIVVSAELSARHRRWTLWHEIAHLVDYTARSRAGGRRVVLSFDSEKGLLSGSLASLLEKHRQFLRRLTLSPNGVWRDGPKRCLEETIWANAAAWRVLIAHIKQCHPHKALAFEAQRESFLLLCTPGRKINELFAEAVSCSIIQPKRMARMAPDLHTAILRVGSRAGIPFAYPSS